MQIGVIGSAKSAAGTMVFPDERFEYINDGRSLVNRTLMLDQDVPKQGGSK